MEINYSRLSKLVYLCLIDGKDDVSVINCIIDKNPYYTFYIDRLAAIFPDAKFTIMIRDYHAYVLSNRQSQKPFVKVLSVFYYAAVWNLHMRSVIRASKSHGAKIQLIKYEDLAENKEMVVKEIAEHLDVQYSPVLFDFYKSVTERLQVKKFSVDQYERAVKRIKDLSSPINMNRVNSWRTQLSSSDISKVDFMCAHTGSFFGYTSVTEPGLGDKMKYWLASVPAIIRVRIFVLLDSPSLNYFINRMQFRKKKNLLYK
jgi:hypothetical protein